MLLDDSRQRPARAWPVLRRRLRMLLTVLTMAMLAAYNATAAAFETLRLSTASVIGSRASASQCSRVLGLSPVPPLPAPAPPARPQGFLSSVSASPVRPMRQNPASPISSSARARLTTRAHGTRSSAPDAALATTPLSGGEWRSWVTMPTAPKAAAERRIAPTLCGSVTWSSTSSTARSGASFKRSSSHASSSGSTSMTTP